MSRFVIFARHNSTERCFMLVKYGQPFKHFQQLLHDKLGGDWLAIDDLKEDDVIYFNSTQEYKGFDNRKDDNYSPGALLKNFKSEKL